MTPDGRRPAVRLEQLRPDEGARLRAIRLRTLRDAPDAFISTIDETITLPPEHWSKQLLDYRTFVAVIEGADVGVVRFRVDPDDSQTGWLHSMWVDAAHRRTGVGGALVDAVIEAGRAAGVKRILLQVVDGNAPAIALYERKGFEPTGSTNHFPPPRQHIRRHQRQLPLAPR